MKYFSTSLLILVAYCSGFATPELIHPAPAVGPAQDAHVFVPPADEPKRTEIKPGIWRVTSLAYDGREGFQNIVFKWHFENSNNILGYQQYPTGDELALWDYFSLDPSATPKQINLLPRIIPPRDSEPLSEQKENAKRIGGLPWLKGIYRLEGDQLEICVAEQSTMPRPKGFEKNGDEKDIMRVKLKWIHDLTDPNAPGIR
jgi:uncharacterized protein (TIGR03067 family)